MTWASARLWSRSAFAAVAFASFAVPAIACTPQTESAGQDTATSTPTANVSPSVTSAVADSNGQATATPTQANAPDLAAAREELEELQTRRDQLVAQVEALQASLSDEGQGEPPEDLVPEAEYEALLDEYNELSARVAELESQLAMSPTPGPGDDSPSGTGAPLPPGDAALAEKLLALISTLEEQLGVLQAKIESPEADQEFTVSGFPVDQLDEARALAETARESVLYLTSTYNAGGSGNATAFLVEPDLAVTNAHNVTQGPGVVADEVELETLYGDTFGASVMGYDNARDVALLRLDQPAGLPVLEWGSAEELTPGDPLLVIGHPGSMGRWITTAGVFEELILRADPATGTFEPPDSTADAYAAELFCSVPGMTGNSGSPILNMDGEVVAVLWGAQAIQGANEEFEEPAPEMIYSEAVVVTREMTAGTASGKAQDLINQFLAGG